MRGLLKEAGYELWENEEDADVIIVNTCAFIEAAQTESIECILELAGYKKHGKAKALIVTGCLAQRYKEQVVREIPEVDAVVGVNEYDKIIDVIKSLDEGGERPENVKKINCSDGMRRTSEREDDSGIYRVLKDCGGLRQPMYILRHPVHTRPVQEQKDGGHSRGGREDGRGGR